MNRQDPSSAARHCGVHLNTAYEWFSTFRCVAAEVVEKEKTMVWGSEKLGGPGCAVQIDESKWGKRKGGKGRQVKGMWVFGMISVEERSRILLFPVPDRTAATLIPLIQANVVPGTTIISDEWPAYKCLPRYGYPHQMVNHTLHFVDPQTGVNTQLIESTWLHVKKSFPDYSIRAKSKTYASYLYQFCYFKLLKSHYGGRDPWLVFLEHWSHVLQAGRVQ